MRLFTLLAALVFCVTAVAQDTDSKEDKTKGLKKISSNSRSMEDLDINIDLSGLSELSSLAALQSLEALEELEGLEVLGDVDIDLSGLEGLEALEEVNLSVEVLEAIDLEAIIEMSLDISTDVLRSLEEIEVDLDRPRRAQK